MLQDDVKSYYGCGLAIPASLEGFKIFDLGIGAGLDVFVEVEAPASDSLGSSWC